MLDKNKNGKIDKTEQKEAMKNIHSMTLPKARGEWSAMDTDGDGKISEDEFLNGVQAISDKVGEEQLLDSIIRAWTDHPLALEKARKEKEAVLAAVAQDGFAPMYADERLCRLMSIDKGIFFSCFFVPRGNVSVSLGGEGAVHKIV